MERVDIKKDETSVSSMFDSIAPKYDRLNSILSLKMDAVWRRRLVKSVLSNNPSTILDVACGTGDLAIAFAKKRINTTAIDISTEMLNIAKAKTPPLSINYIKASAEAIPTEESSFDSVTIGFGIRNFANREKALKEIYRVLNHGGTITILEFAIPKNTIWKNFYLLYFRKILPYIGKLISKNDFAYNYLPESVLTFPQYEEFAEEIGNAGFSEIKYTSFSGGIALMYSAVKP